MSMDQATVTLPYVDFEELKRQKVEFEQKYNDLLAKDRSAALEATPHATSYVKGLLGARICIGFAISKLGAAFTPGWPVDALQAFLEGLEHVDNGDPDVQQSVRDFRVFIGEVNEAEAVRRERKLNPPKPVDALQLEQQDRAKAILAEHEEKLRQQKLKEFSSTDGSPYVEELPHSK